VLLTGRPQTLVDGLRQRIWRRAVDKADVESLREQLRLVSTRLQAGRTVVRAYADGPPLPGFECAEPDLEDVYFCAIAGYLQPTAA
jgi:hypothetical protein